MHRVRVSHTLRILPAVLIASAGSATAWAAPPLPFPPALELSALNGTDGFVITGINANDGCGGAVSSAGDVNGDGIDDFAVGAVAASPNGQTYAGETYIVFGGPSIGALGTFDPASLNGSNGFVIQGIAPSDGSGDSVAPAGDINGDGADDLIIGAPFADPTGLSRAGQSYVVFGGPGVGASGSIALSSLNGTNGFIINGIDANDRSGRSVAAGGDVNGDGIDDILIGAYIADPNGQSDAGETYVVFGGPGVGAGGILELSSLNGMNGFAIEGIDADDLSGFSVSSAGDINGDGVTDILIGAHRADPNGNAYAGEAYVVFGGPGIGVTGSIGLSALNGTNGFVVNGIAMSNWCGHSVCSLGDVNGDGLDDIMVGAPLASPAGQPYAGQVYVVLGAPTVGASGSIDLAGLNGIDGFALNGVRTSFIGDFTGHAVSSAGDINGDGINDMLIGAHYADPGGRPYAGRTYVVFGGVGVGVSGSIDLGALTGTNGFLINGIAQDDSIGSAVSSAGDVNADGVDDILIGAQYASPNGQTYAGLSFVIFGRAPVVCVGDITGDGLTNAADFTVLAGSFGSSVTPNTNGDLNGDGLVNAADFVILAGDFGCGAP